MISHPDLVSTEPAYLMSHAAAYIALRRFRPAHTDCQHAVSLQSQPSGSATAPPKTLLCLALPIVRSRVEFPCVRVSDHSRSPPHLCVSMHKGSTSLVLRRRLQLHPPLLLICAHHHKRGRLPSRPCPRSQPCSPSFVH